MIVINNNKHEEGKQMTDNLIQAVKLLGQLNASETRTLYELAMTQTFKLEAQAKLEAQVFMSMRD